MLYGGWTKTSYFCLLKKENYLLIKAEIAHYFIFKISHFTPLYCPYLLLKALIRIRLSNRLDFLTHTVSSMILLERLSSVRLVDCLPKNRTRAIARTKKDSSAELSSQEQGHRLISTLH